jgi:hypothetical protein
MFRDLPDLPTAVAAVERVAAERPTGASGLRIRNAASGEEFDIAAAKGALAACRRE